MYNFTDLTKIIAELRSDHGCPWDRKQTFESLKKCLADETAVSYTHLTLPTIYSV